MSARSAGKGLSIIVVPDITRARTTTTEAYRKRTTAAGSRIQQRSSRTPASGVNASGGRSPRAPGCAGEPEFVHPTRTLRSPSTSSRLRACWTKPGAGWVDSHPGHVDPPSVQLEEAQHGQAPQPDGLDREEVAGDDPGGLLSEERPPRRGRPSRSWIYPMTSERCADRGCRDSHAQPLEFTLHALVTRARNLASQADDQLLYVGVQLRPARGTMRISPGTCDQPPMPAKQRFGLDEEAGPAGSRQRAAEGDAGPEVPGP